jgi:hypothetical protein
LEVEVVESNTQSMKVAVPGTVMEFELRRSRDDAAFEGVIGGRYFRFDPSASTTRESASTAPKGRKVASA